MCVWYALSCVLFIASLRAAAEERADGCTGCSKGVFTVTYSARPVVGWATPNPDGIACSNICCEATGGTERACCICKFCKLHASRALPAPLPQANSADPALTRWMLLRTSLLYRGLHSGVLPSPCPKRLLRSTSGYGTQVTGDTLGHAYECPTLVPATPGMVAHTLLLVQRSVSLGSLFLVSSFKDPNHQLG